MRIIRAVHPPAIQVSDRQHDVEVQNIHLIQDGRSVGTAVLLGGVGRHRARLEISERLLRRPPGTGGARMRLCRARQPVSGGDIVVRDRRVSSVQTRQRGLEMRADRAVVYSLRSGPQLLVLLLQFSHQLLEFQHLQLRVGDFTVTTDVCHHLGAQHLGFHLVTSTLRGGRRERGLSAEAPALLEGGIRIEAVEGRCYPDPDAAAAAAG